MLTKLEIDPSKFNLHGKTAFDKRKALLSLARLEWIGSVVFYRNPMGVKDNRVVPAIVMDIQLGKNREPQKADLILFSTSGYRIVQGVPRGQDDGQWETKEITISAAVDSVLTLFPDLTSDLQGASANTSKDSASKSSQPTEGQGVTTKSRDKGDKESPENL